MNYGCGLAGEYYRSPAPLLPVLRPARRGGVDF